MLDDRDKTLMIGDLVIKPWLTETMGMVIGVRKNNQVSGYQRRPSDIPPSVYQYVYYVIFIDGRFEGPLFHSELINVSYL